MSHSRILMGYIFASDIPSAVSDAQCKRLGQLAQGKVVLELGAQYGRSTIALASTALRVHSVDWHLGDAHAGMLDSLPTFIANISRYGLRQNIITHVGRNESVLPALASGTFELVFIDSFHEKEAVTRDISLVLRLLKRPAVVAFHDYGQAAFPGVTEAVDAFRKDMKSDIELVESMAIIKAI